MIQLHPPTEWMTKTYYQTTGDPTIINARHFQSKGTNQEISLLISMVAQKMSTHKPDSNTNRIIGTALQYHSTSTLIKARKHKTNLRDLHYEISTKHYPVPTEKELCPTTFPTLFQINQHPYTAFDDIDSLTPQEIEYIMTTFCERFYPQVTNPLSKNY
jgi:hypothetical protein